MLKVMKGFAGLGGFIILVIGLAMLGVTIWAFTNAALSFNQYTFLGVLLAFDLLIIFAAVLGICGIKRQNGFMICVFQIFVMIFFIAFVSIGIVAEVLPAAVFEGNCTNSQNALIQRAFNTSVVGQVVLCSPLCPCGLTQSAIDNSKYNISDMIIINMLFKSPTGPVRFQDCDVAKNMPQENKDMAEILQAIETSFECSGWCSDFYWPIYSFSNVNNGKPTSTCYDTMKNKLQQYGSVLGISAFVASAFLLLVCVCGLCVCCAPDRRNQPYSSRFIVDDNGTYKPM